MDQKRFDKMLADIDRLADKIKSVRPVVGWKYRRDKAGRLRRKRIVVFGDS